MWQHLNFSRNFYNLRPTECPKECPFMGFWGFTLPNVKFFMEIFHNFLFGNSNCLETRIHILNSLNVKLIFYPPPKGVRICFQCQILCRNRTKSTYLHRLIEEIWQDFQDFKNDVNFYGRFQFWPLKPNLALQVHEKKKTNFRMGMWAKLLSFSE